MSVIDLRVGKDLDDLSEFELLDLYVRVRSLLAERLSRKDGGESIEMLFARLADVVEPAAPRVPKTRISPREREVLHFLAQEKTNAEIAATLFISENTVKNHVRNILEKLGLHSRMEAVMYAMRTKLLELP